jgi:hypothetical protein
LQYRGGWLKVWIAGTEHQWQALMATTEPKRETHAQYIERLKAAATPEVRQLIKGTYEVDLGQDRSGR